MMFELMLLEFIGVGISFLGIGWISSYLYYDFRGAWEQVKREDIIDELYGYYKYRRVRWKHNRSNEVLEGTVTDYDSETVTLKHKGHKIEARHNEITILSLVD